MEHVSHTDTAVNTLSRIAARYPGREMPAIAEPGDVVFFAGHILHRSHTNRSPDRFRRAFVSHYANARSFTMWGGPDRQRQTNDRQILARGWTHLPFGQPRFGTPCAANGPPPNAAQRGDEPMPMALMADGDEMQAAAQQPQRNDPALMREHERRRRAVAPLWSPLRGDTRPGASLWRGDGAMLLTITTTHRPATDLGFLLVKNPARCQSFSLSFRSGPCLLSGRT